MTGIVAPTETSQRKETARRVRAEQTAQRVQHLEKSRPIGWSGSSLNALHVQHGGSSEPRSPGVPRINANSRRLARAGDESSVFDRLHSSGMTTRRGGAATDRPKASPSPVSARGTESARGGTSAWENPPAGSGKTNNELVSGALDEELSGEEIQQVLQWKKEGNTAAAAKDFEQAIDNFAEALRVFGQRQGEGQQVTEKVSILSNQAECYIQLEEWSRAVHAANEALRLWPGKLWEGGLLGWAVGMGNLLDSKAPRIWPSA